MCASARTKTVGFSGDELVIGAGGLCAPSFGGVIGVCERARRGPALHPKGASYNELSRRCYAALAPGPV
jgi:hypothetical protein